MGARRKFHELAFDNRYARLPPEFHAPARPTPLTNPRLVAFNPDEAGRPEFVECLTGLHPLPGGEPVARRYAGHQFGHYAPQLGDGRALCIVGSDEPVLRETVETGAMLLRDPFAERPEMEAYAAAPPDWAETIVVSCSS